MLDSGIIEELRALGREVEQDVLGEVVSAYRKLAPELVAQMTDALSQGAADRLSRAAHSLKGGSGQIGATAVADFARSIESAAKEGRLAELAPVLTRCIAALNEADAELAALVGECRA